MRPVTLFTGQWADLPIAELLPKVAEMGYDGVELACWGDHFDVTKALEDDSYIPALWDLLKKHELGCYAISSHLVGQAICDNIDDRHKAILSPEIYGDGTTAGVNQRAADELARTAIACRKFVDAGAEYMKNFPTGTGKAVVSGFTGSSIWHALYAFPPTNQEFYDAGFEKFADLFTPILETFEKHDVYFGLEVHPTEIAFDIVTAHRALEAVNMHPRFGFNYDPSHLGYQGVDYVRFIREFGERIHHAHVKDAWWGRGEGSVGVFGGNTDFGDARRYWDFRSPGRGDVDFEEVIVALNDVGYAGPLSVEWEDGRMDRIHGATEACQFVRGLDFPRSNVAFDAAFDKSEQ